MRVFRYGGFGGGRILRGNCHNNGAGDRRYGVATVSRIDKIIGLFCRI